jgi:ABC-2 type transport system ATP-binding protein
MSIVVENLTKVYGSQKALDSVSFTLNKGEIVGFIGSNGSGKSTTMKSICGLLTPDSGRILIEGKDVQGAGIEIKGKIGYLPENNPLYSDQYVIEYLRNVGKFYPIRDLKSRVLEIIELTGLLPEKHKKIGQLSKGYKQRVGLAQALIHDPEILILDEPTTGLDPNQLTEIRELIRNIAEDKTVMLSTHILQEVEAICQRVIMINRGKIVTDGATDSVRKGSDGQMTVVVEFKEKVSVEDIVKIEGAIDYKMILDNKWLIGGGANIDIRENIFNFAKEKNISILELQTKKKSLEETFRQLSQDNPEA